MIWATVSSWSCFCWLYRTSPSLTANNIINLILALTIWWCPCVESSLVLLEEGVSMTSVFSLRKTLLDFALLHFVLQGQICLLLQMSLDFLLLHFIPLWWKGHHSQKTPEYSQASLAQTSTGLQSQIPWEFSVPLLCPQIGKSVLCPRTFLTGWAFLWYNCSAVCGSCARWLYGGPNGDVHQEGLCHVLGDPGLL